MSSNFFNIFNKSKLDYKKFDIYMRKSPVYWVDPVILCKDRQYDSGIFTHKRYFLYLNSKLSKKLVIKKRKFIKL